MTFTLTYQQGSFRQSEVFVSRICAVARAYIVLGGIGCSGHQIHEDGTVVMHESEIVEGCEEAVRMLTQSAEEIGSPV